MKKTPCKWIQRPTTTAILWLAILMMIGIGCNDTGSSANSSYTEDALTRIEKKLEIYEQIQDHMTRVDDRLKILDEDVKALKKELEEKRNTQLEKKVASIEKQLATFIKVMQKKNSQNQPFPAHNESEFFSIEEKVIPNAPTKIKIFNREMIINAEKMSKDGARFTVLLPDGNQKAVDMKRGDKETFRVYDNVLMLYLMKSSEFESTVYVRTM